ncbi:DNA recombination protein RmuC [Mycoplasmopsis caviae]|uniref:DNA recombination protein RmuC n=1 Tax=Mycoplasmopsis caviae TaxID=55603 RepID=A0A3P8KXC4_9BACT|nr:DNA recombination protein RmuC [Mycoplasmopsis caviae]UUD34935.1 DNA recombination protein RmuC [Mycoplasmopsis caviae]VDR42237.1 RmuC family [Mycoplasmopsis caviae]
MNLDMWSLALFLISLFVSIASIFLTMTIYLWTKHDSDRSEKIIKSIKEELDKEIPNHINNLGSNIDTKITNSFTMINDNFKSLREEIETKMKSFEISIKDGISNIRDEINKKFEDEISKKMNENFKNIKENMENLDKNLIRFETLQESVKSLQKTFDGTKSRGNFGEFNLQNVLSEHLSKDLWAAQVDLKKLSKTNLSEASGVLDDDTSNNERVDFAIKMPNSDNDENGNYLPIDCKFPLQSFIEYQEADSKDDRLKAQANFRKVIIEQAKSISSKYIIKNVTTKHAIMYLPSEAVFALAVSDTELNTLLNKNYNITLAGPTTILVIIQTIAYFNYGISMKQNVDILLDQFAEFRKSQSALQSKIEGCKKKNDNTGIELERAMNIVQKMGNKINKSVEFAMKKGVLKPDYDFESHIKNSPMLEGLSDEYEKEDAE